MKIFVLARPLAGLILGIAPGLALAQTAPPAANRAFEATTLDVAAYGETEVAPDEAILSLGVQSRAANAADAVSQNAAQMNAVLAALRKAGVADHDIRTTNLNLSAQYNYSPDKPPLLEGYAAGNDVSVTVRDIARVGAVIDAATTAGANQINSIGFGLKDAAAAEDAARLAAVKALAAKAALYANASGYHVLRLVSLTEQGAGAPGPVRPMAMLAQKAATPVSAGALTVRVDVDGVFELAK